MAQAITALINTRNEESNLPDCLRSVSWADEVVVADMASTDRTREVAEQHGARVIQVPVAQGAFEWVRNFAATQCASEWILVVDADERVMPALARTLRTLAQQAAPAIAAFGLPRRNHFLGQWLEHGFWPDHQIRFFRKGRLKWTEMIHDLPQVDGQTELLPADPEAALDHPGYGDNLTGFIERHVRYAPLDARRLAATQRPAAWPFLIRRPLGEFYGRYFRAGAWRYGLTGLVWSLLMANYQLLIGVHYWAETRAAGPNELAPSALRRSVRWEAVRSFAKWLHP